MKINEDHIFKVLLRERFMDRPIQLIKLVLKLFFLGKKEEVKDAISNWISSIKNAFMARIISKILRFQSKMAYIRNKK